MAFYKICPDCGASLDPGEKVRLSGGSGKEAGVFQPALENGTESEAACFCVRQRGGSV